MANYRNANSVARLSKEEVKGKAPEVYAPAIPAFKMETVWVSCGSLDERIQFVPEFVPKMAVDSVVVFENRVKVILD
jgi:hypothetical protein